MLPYVLFSLSEFMDVAGIVKRTLAMQDNCGKCWQFSRHRFNGSLLFFAIGGSERYMLISLGRDDV